MKRLVMVKLIRDFLTVATKPCRAQTAIINRDLDSPLSRGEALGLGFHLTYCRNCRRFRQQVMRLRDAARSLEKIELDSMPSDVRLRLLGRVNAGSDNPPSNS